MNDEKKQQQKLSPMDVTGCERALLEYIRNRMSYGEIKICVKNSQPYRIESGIQSEML